MTSPLLLLLNLAGIGNLANMLEDLGQLEQAVICWRLLQNKNQGEHAAQAGWNLRRLKGREKESAST